MSVATRIVSCLIGPAGEARVSDVRIGLGYTAVSLSNGRAGVAYTFLDEARGGCSVFAGIRPLVGRPATDLLALLVSGDPIEAAVGLACANALANRRDENHLDGNVLDHIGIGTADNVAMVGNFAPLVEEIEKHSRSLTIFERIEQPSGFLRPEKEALEALPRCDVAIITATAIINRTIDDLLSAAANAREVVILGASTPLVPDVFTGKATVLSGVVVKNPDGVLRVVSERGGMRQFGPHIRKVTVRV
ncbi:MAG TPA: DUF364 domain-containing protein, partial [Polyangia bacterium]|nr:DUF364 domain-containing protein [Polyangia bacterium]